MVGGGPLGEVSCNCQLIVVTCVCDPQTEYWVHFSVACCVVVLRALHPAILHIDMGHSTTVCGVGV